MAPAFADVVETGLLAAVRRLEAFPQSGRRVPEIDDAAIREVIWREYRVLYHTDDDGDRVDVLSALHTARPIGEGRRA